MFNSLFRKIMGSALLIPVLILIVLSLLLPRVLEDFIYENKEDELMRKARIVQGVLLNSNLLEGNLNTGSGADDYSETGGPGMMGNRGRGGPGMMGSIPMMNSRLLAVFENILDTGIVIFNQNGQIINRGQMMAGMMRSRLSWTRGNPTEGRESFPLPPLVPGELINKNSGVMRVLQGEQLTFRGESPAIDQPVIVVGVPVEKADAGDSEPTALFLFAPLRGLELMAYRIRNLTLEVTLGAVAAALLLAYLLARGITRPIKEMEGKARQLAEGNYKVRIENLPRDEVGRLGESFNYLAGELEETVAALNTEKNRMENMLVSMSEGVLGISSEGEILLANPRLKEILGLEEAAAGSVLKSHLPAEIGEMTARVIEEKTGVKREFDWEGRVIDSQASPVYKSEGKLWGVIILIRDVTGLRKLEEMRRLFVANVSHELKTPLTAVQGYIEAVLDGVVDDIETQRRYLKRVLAETDRMSRLTGEILDLSRLQSGQSEFELSEVELTAVIRSVLNDFSSRLGERRVVLDLPDKAVVTADRDRLRQVVINLLSNALKFTAADGEIRVAVEEQPLEEKYLVKVIDDGVGIPAGELPYIWERFHQVDRARRPGGAGTGLGLAIAKEIVEGLGGEVGVTSRPGQGSSFYFTLPAAPGSLES